MADITPSVLSNAILGKIYDVLTSGDATVPPSPDNFLSWATPGYPMTDEDFRFLTQGIAGTVTQAAAAALLAATAVPPAGGGAPPAPTGLTPDQISQLRADDTRTVMTQAENFARLVDFIPDVSSMDVHKPKSLTIQTDNGTLSEVYDMTLTMSQIMQSVVPAAEAAKIAQMRALLTATTKTYDLVTGAEIDVVGPSPMVVAYTTKMAAYNNAALAYNAVRIDALAGTDPVAVETFAMNAPILRDQVTAAMSDWVTTGYKDQYEEIAAYIAQVEGRDMSLLVAGYRDDLEKAKLTGISSGSDFYYTSAVPADFYQSSGWSKFHFSASDFERYQNSSFHSSGWSVQASAGFFGFGAHGGASASSSNSQFSASLDSRYCTMSFEICQVSIIRPWFKTSYLNSKTWKFDSNNPTIRDQILSDGASPPTGLMPAYPTSMILVRNLVLDFGDNSAAQSFMAQQSASSQGGGGGFSFGPFSISSSASHSSAQGSTAGSQTGSAQDQGMGFPGMQIVGFRCHVMPKAPNPSPAITSWI